MYDDNFQTEKRILPFFSGISDRVFKSLTIYNVEWLKNFTWATTNQLLNQHGSYESKEYLKKHKNRKTIQKLFFFSTDWWKCLIMRFSNFIRTFGKHDVQTVSFLSKTNSTDLIKQFNRTSYKRTLLRKSSPSPKNYPPHSYNILYYTNYWGPNFFGWSDLWS